MSIGATTLAFDHVHLVSADPTAAAQWYVDFLGARLLSTTTVFDVPQIYLSFGASLVLVRGVRTGEQASAANGVHWGVDHFGFRVEGDFEAFCASLKARGVRFTMAPMDVNAVTRAAYIVGPDNVRIELLLRREWPNLVTFGLAETPKRAP